MATLMRLFLITRSLRATLPRGLKRACLMTVMVTLVGCGQKGALYLEPSTAAVGTESDTTISTSQPQDASFADIDDDAYDKSRYLEQKQILSAPDDPNDY